MASERDAMVEQEVGMVSKKAGDIPGVSLVTCLPIMVKATITHTDHKQLSVMMQFPTQYPNDILLMELTSKTLSTRLLDGLLKVCEEEARKMLGSKQVLHMLKFISKFMEENPLCVCSDEISYIKKELVSEGDEVKLKQKMSQVSISLRQGNYRCKIRITVPPDYPTSQVKPELVDCNFPDLLRVFFQAQAVEIARKCVQPPLRRKPKDPPFKPRPSLQPVCVFLIRDCIKFYPVQSCPVCKERVLPENPTEVSTCPTKAVERVYCGHLYHNGCMDTYMKTPPFTGGKMCPSCGKRIFHDKWSVTPEVAEARWAHQQARQRELEEVVDFMNS